MPTRIQIETERLLFRECTFDDLEELTSLFSDEETMQQYRGTRSSEETIEWLSKTTDTWDSSGYGYWMLNLKDSGETIGTAGLFECDVDDMPEIEVGFVLHSKYWGCGLGGEAAAACYEYALETINLDRIVTLTDPRNTACTYLAQQHGLTFERQTAMWGRTVHVYAHPAS